MRLSAFWPLTLKNRLYSAGEVYSPDRSNRDAVAVIVERDFVDQRRADGVRGVNDAGVRRVAKRVSDGRNVVAAPHTGGKVLGDLFGHEVAIDRELVARRSGQCERFLRARPWGNSPAD